MSSSTSRKLALISVSDKTDIDKIAKELINNNYDILSTGGTAKFLTKNIHDITSDAIFACGGSGPPEIGRRL